MSCESYLNNYSSLHLPRSLYSPPRSAARSAVIFRPLHKEDTKPPPPIDPELCKGKTAGAVVETKTPDGRSITGTCQLVFLPNRPASDEKPRY
jgi:hypothetical protein